MSRLPLCLPSGIAQTLTGLTGKERYATDQHPTTQRRRKQRQHVSRHQDVKSYGKMGLSFSSVRKQEPSNFIGLKSPTWEHLSLRLPILFLFPRSGPALTHCKYNSEASPLKSLTANSHDVLLLISDGNMHFPKVAYVMSMT